MPDDLHRLEYSQTTDLLRTLTDTRFKLLAFTPTIAGTAVALLGRHSSPAELLAVGTLGLAASIGIVLYELHNTQVYEYALVRAEQLEGELGIDLYTSRPHHAHDRPLAIVYAAALGGWTYLVAWGALGAADVGNAQKLGGLIAAVVALLVGIELGWTRRKREGPARAADPSAVTSAGS
jgi:hypothetical protein